MDTPAKRTHEILKYLGWLNGLCIAGGLAYLLCPRMPWLGNISFVGYLAALSGNAFMAFRHRERARTAAEKLCVATVLGMTVMMIGNFIYSNNYSVSWQNLWYWQAVVAVGYLAPLLSGIWLVHKLKQSFPAQIPEASVPSEKKRMPAVLRGLIGVPLILWLLLGCLAGLKMFSGQKFFWMEILVPDVAIFFAFIFLFEGVLLACLLNTSANRLWGRGIFIFSVAVFLLFMLPIFVTPSAIANAQRSFDDHFHPPVFPAEDERAFRTSAFDGMSCLLGVKPEKVRVLKKILYYQGDAGVDAGIRLYFDAYLPPDDPQKLPGHGSVLIRIHGGGWRIGDKGEGNILQMNKYFAAQGYVVFDLQYGLYRAPKGWAPPYVSGDFSADDMVRHIGLFTKYLATHTNEYQANLNSVFISGGSAGGQLAAAVALGITSKKYPDWFASGLTVRGLIPFYPAFNLLSTAHIRGSAAVNDPSLLIDSNSPPCLIFQGTADTLVNPKIPEVFCEAYQAKAVNPAAILWMPLGGHASDLYFPGNYNQIFLYHMERFMAMYR